MKSDMQLRTTHLFLILFGLDFINQELRDTYEKEARENKDEISRTYQDKLEKLQSKLDYERMNNAGGLQELRELTTKVRLFSISIFFIGKVVIENIVQLATYSPKLIIFHELHKRIISISSFIFL